MELEGSATLVLAAGILCLALLWEWKQQQQSRKFPPGPTPLPLLGNALQLSRGDLFTSLMAVSRRHVKINPLEIPREKPSGAKVEGPHLYLRVKYMRGL